jgi:hypothetical protein
LIKWSLIEKQTEKHCIDQKCLAFIVQLLPNFVYFFLRFILLVYDFSPRVEVRAINGRLFHIRFNILHTCGKKHDLSKTIKMHSLGSWFSSGLEIHLLNISFTCFVWSTVQMIQMIPLNFHLMCRRCALVLWMILFIHYSPDVPVMINLC